MTSGRSSESDEKFADRYQLLVATAVVTSGGRVPVARCQSVRIRSGAV